MALVVIGYGAIGLTPNPMSAAAIPALVAQEALIDSRGSVLGLFAFCGAGGLLVLSLLSGHLFDSIGTGAPFLLVAGVNGIVLFSAIFVRRKTGYKSPGMR